MNTIKIPPFLFLAAFMLCSSFCGFSQQTIAEWNFPNGPDDAIVDVAVPINAGATISSQGGTGAVGYGQAGASTFSANATGWQSGFDAKWWEITISTTGYTNLDVSSRQYSSNTGPRNFKIQYRIGVGAWTDLPGATTIVLAANFTTGFVNAVPLPVGCENQPSVSLRWIMTSNTAVGGAAVASGGNSRIDDINISWNSDDYYRSVMTGNWNNIATWESSPDNILWNPAVMPPSRFARTITVRSPHTVSITANATMDEVTIDNGGTLNFGTALITLYDGPGVDLQVDGTFVDASPNNFIWNAGSRWAMGTNGTYIKTATTSAVNWQNNYNGGIVNIPASANWYIRKTGGASPALTNVNMFYPNLTIENVSGGNWVTNPGSTFTGNAGFPTIKGNFDIGGVLGLGTVDFLNDNTNAQAALVLKNMIIRSGSSIRNNGTGYEIQGDLIADGTANYGASNGRRFIFSGSAAQSISGAGTLNILNLWMNKSGNDLTLLRPVKVDSNLNFNTPGGRIFSSVANLITIESTATATGTSNTGFVHGPVQKLGAAAFTFPVGKNNDYQSIGMSAGAGGGGGIFWNEDFGTGCNQGLLASSYSGPNGAWTIASTGVNNAQSNKWYVSATEAGMGTGNCGNGCLSNGALTNRTLHVGANDGFTATDPGAAYNAGGLCGFLFCVTTNWRAESPVIDCSGYSTITLNFKYIENGSGSVDNATVWYYDGAVWSLLADMAKTSICGGQGLWAAYSMALPASADNNPNVKIGFNWTNNDDGVGTDPSFAVDDVQLSTAAATESFTAEYFRGNPQVVYNNNVNPFIDHISQCEYWTLTHDAGTSARTVTLSWDGNSCGVTNLANLTVARFNSLSWDDRGNGGTTGNTTAGTITSATVQTDFGPFTLASTTPQNPLPVELISFDANYKNKMVYLRWTTATEINNDYFLVQRSQSGKEFETIATIKGSGNSNHSISYDYYDESPFSGISYYRLMQVDYDGRFEFTKSVAVRVMGAEGGLSILSISIPFESDQIFVQIYSPSITQSNLEIFGTNGQKVHSKRVDLNPGVNYVEINRLFFTSGLYSLRIIDWNTMVSGKFLLLN